MPNRSAINAAALNGAGGPSTGAAGLTVEQSIYSVVVTGKTALTIRQQVVLAPGGTGAAALIVQQVITAPIGRATLSIQQPIILVGQTSIVIEQAVVPYDTGMVGISIEQPIYAAGVAALSVEQIINDDVAAGVIWRPRVILGGVDISASLTGMVRVELEEGTARIAEFTAEPMAGSVAVSQWVAQPVSIDFELTDLGGGLVRRERLFTGMVQRPEYDPESKLTRFECSDGLQELVQDMTTDQVAAAAGGQWSAAVFDADADSWQRFEDRMSTQTASYDLNRFGSPRKTEWQPKLVPDRTLGMNELLYRTIGVEIGPRRSLVNRVEIEFAYRYRRDKQREKTYTYSYPLSICEGLNRTKPNRSQVMQAIEGTGWTLAEGPYYTHLPPSGVIPCGATQIPWLISEALRAELVTGAVFRLAQRYSQTVTERYRLTVMAPLSVAQFGEITQTRSANLSAEFDADWGFADGYVPLSGERDQHGDLFVDRTESESDGREAADAAIETLLAQAAAIIARSHRANTVRCATLLDPTIDTHQTIRIAHDALEATGKCSRVVHECDLDRGAATTEIMVAVSRTDQAGSVSADELTAPEPPETYAPGAAPSGQFLPTHFGGLTTSPPFDDDWDGYVGNAMSIPAGAMLYGEFKVGEDPITGDPITEDVQPVNQTVTPGTEAYPVRFGIKTDELDAPRQPVEAERVQSFNVSIPNDPLSMAA